MTDHYAACLSLSQGSNGTTARAFLLLSSEGRTHELALEWPPLGEINANLDVSEWLYSALSRLVTNYDDHLVVKAKLEPFDSMEKGLTHEA